MNCPHCGAPITPGIRFCSICGGTVAAALAGAPGKKSNGALIAVGIAVAGVFLVFIIGVVAALVIPNVLSARQRGQQKRTVADLRTLTAALSRYQADYNHYPAAQDIDGLCKALENYLPACPRSDGWSTPEQPRRYAYAAWGTPAGCAVRPGDNMCGPLHCGLASAGKDGLFENARFTDYSEEKTSSYNSDLVVLDGEIVRQPEGAQHNLDLAGGSREPPAAPPEPPRAQLYEPAAQAAAGSPAGMPLPEGAGAAAPDSAQLRAQTQAQLLEMRSVLAGYLESRREYPSPQDAEELCILLRSRGLHNCSPNDAWGHPLRYQSWKFTNRNSSTQWISAFVLVSGGPDGRLMQLDAREFLQPGGDHGDDIAVYGGYDPEWAERHASHDSAASSTPVPLSLPAN